jgi:hypothetical protein
MFVVSSRFGKDHRKSNTPFEWRISLDFGQACLTVMPGLVPGIHVLLRVKKKTWMAGIGERE